MYGSFVSGVGAVAGLFCLAIVIALIFINPVLSLLTFLGVAVLFVFLLYRSRPRTSYDEDLDS